MLVCMHVCIICVCMYICKYVCMYVCMHVFMCECMLSCSLHRGQANDVSWWSLRRPAVDIFLFVWFCSEEWHSFAYRVFNFGNTSCILIFSWSTLWATTSGRTILSLGHHFVIIFWLASDPSEKWMFQFSTPHVQFCSHKVKVYIFKILALRLSQRCLPWMPTTFISWIFPICISFV